MEDSKLGLKIRNVIKSHWMIVISFVGGAILTVLVIGIPLSRGADPREYPANYDAVKWACIGLSIFTALGKFWFQKNRLYKIATYEKCRNLGEIIKRYGNNFLLSLGFCYAVFLFGLILFFLTLQMREWAPFLILSGILFATSTPSMKGFRAIVDSHTAEKSQVDESFVGEVGERVDLKGVADLDRALIPSLFRRTIAFIIDVLIAYGLMFIAVAGMIAGKIILPEDAGISLSVLSIVLFGVYQAVSIYFGGRTFGCFATRIRIISSDGSKLTFNRALIRAFIMTGLLFFWPGGIPIFPLFHIGHILITTRWGKNEFKQAEWDLVARTVVVKARAVEPS